MEAFKDLKRKNETSTLLSQLPETPVWLKKSFAELNVHDTDTKSDPITPARRQQDRSSEFDSLSTPAAIRIIDGTTISPIEATVSQMYTTEYSKEKYSLKSKNQPSFLRSTPITRSLMKSSGEDGLKQSQNGSVKKEVRISEENEYFESPDRFEEPK